MERSVVILFLFLCVSCATSNTDDFYKFNENHDKRLDRINVPSTKNIDDELEADPLKKTARRSTAHLNKKDEFAKFDDHPGSPQGNEQLARQTSSVISDEPKFEPQGSYSGTPAKIVNIKSIDFRTNNNGGTVVVEADGPMIYGTKNDTTTGQFIVEISNSILSPNLTRSLVTKDFEGPVGAVDIYQLSGSRTSRIVVHLRPGSSEPFVQLEGNSLLVVASLQREKRTPENEVKLMSYNSLEEFMSGNMAFSGKKISIETNNMGIAGVFRLISDEVGVNLMVSDDVRGDISIKLKQVPWDQAMVMIMKTKKLGFTRTGNALRIAPVAQIQAEEDELIKITAAKRETVPLTVKVIPVSYAKINDMVDQIRPFLSEKRGKVVGDIRTSSVIVSDIQENIDQIEKLVVSIDIPPQQVLIEGKVVEAQENFQRQLGVWWQAGGLSAVMGTNSAGNNIGSTMGVSVTPGQISPVTGALKFHLGTLDVLGDLSAMLSLHESQGLVKVLSSPRVVALHNEEATITQTQELPLITSNISSGVSSTSVNFKPVKLRLNVTPNITNDGGVLMKVEVNREFAGEIVDKPSQARPINGRSAQTKVLVRNGQTAVIGGIYQDDSTESESRVPWLGSLPVFGWLFKNKAATSNKNELLIFITPRILGQLDGQSIQTQQSFERGGK